MAHIEFSELSYILPNGEVLFADVSFVVGEGAKTALIGANGSGKTTLMRMMSGQLVPTAGQVVASGEVGVMPQFIGTINDDIDVRAFLLGFAPESLRAAGDELAAAEMALLEQDDEKAQIRYAQALADWGDVGGYDAEVLWNKCTSAAIGLEFQRCEGRLVRSLSGGEQKRLALEALLRGPAAVLILDEPDNYLDVPGKVWLEQSLTSSPKTVLFISHDRELIARVADRLVTLEAHGAWVHGGGFATYDEARRARRDRLDQLHKRWDEEHERLRQLVFTLRQQAKISSALASKLAAAETRLRKFVEAGPPPERVVDQKVVIRPTGGRTGVRVVQCENLEITSLVRPFDLEVFYGDRVAVLGANGTGKSHFLRLLDRQPVNHTGNFRLGARVTPGWFSQTHEQPQWSSRTLVEILHRGDESRDGLDRGAAIKALSRYELHGQCDQYFDQLSGGQQARFQILALELSQCTLLLLDEPTDNLDIASSEALEEGLEMFDGTVMAVTHDRWFARNFDRFLIFDEGGTVNESTDPRWDIRRR